MGIYTILYWTFAVSVLFFNVSLTFSLKKKIDKNEELKKKLSKQIKCSKCGATDFMDEFVGSVGGR